MTDDDNDVPANPDNGMNAINDDLTNADDDAKVNTWLARGDGHLDSSRVETAVHQISVQAFRDLDFSPAIVWDYLTISTPNLFTEAGYTEAEVDELLPVVESAITAATNHESDD